MSRNRKKGWPTWQNTKHHKSTIYNYIIHQSMLWNKFDFRFCLGRRSPIWLILSNHHFEPFRQSFGTLTLKVSRLHCACTWLHTFLQIISIRFFLSVSRWFSQLVVYHDYSRHLKTWQIRATNSLVRLWQLCLTCLRGTLSATRWRGQDAEAKMSFFDRKNPMDEEMETCHNFQSCFLFFQPKPLGNLEKVV